MRIASVMLEKKMLSGSTILQISNVPTMQPSENTEGNDGKKTSQACHLVDGEICHEAVAGRLVKGFGINLNSMRDLGGRLPDMIC